MCQVNLKNFITKQRIRLVMLTMSSQIGNIYCLYIDFWNLGGDELFFCCAWFWECIAQQPHFWRLREFHLKKNNHSSWIFFISRCAARLAFFSESSNCIAIIPVSLLFVLQSFPLSHCEPLHTQLYLNASTGGAATFCAHFVANVNINVWVLVIRNCRYCGLQTYCDINTKVDLVKCFPYVSHIKTRRMRQMWVGWQRTVRLQLRIEVLYGGCRAANANCYTERFACILCMHLGACGFFTHPTALMHLKKWIFRKFIQLHFSFLAPTRMGSH